MNIFPVELTFETQLELLTLLRSREEEPVWWELLRNDKSAEFVLSHLRVHPKILLQLSQLTASNILINLVKNGSYGNLSTLIELGADVNSSEKGRSALEYIIDVGNGDLIVQAVKAGADVNIRLPFHIKRQVVETVQSKFTRSRYSHGDKFNAFYSTTFDSEKTEYKLEHVGENWREVNHEKEEDRQLMEDPTIFCRICLMNDLPLVSAIIDSANSESLRKAFTLSISSGEIDMARLILAHLKDKDQHTLENMILQCIVTGGNSDIIDLIFDSIGIEDSERGEHHVIKRARMVSNLTHLSGIDRYPLLKQVERRSLHSLPDSSTMETFGNVLIVGVDDTDPELVTRTRTTIDAFQPEILLLPLNSQTAQALLESMAGLGHQVRERLDKLNKVSAVDRTPEMENQRTYDYRVVQSELWPYRDSVAAVEAASHLKTKLPTLVLTEPEPQELYTRLSSCSDRLKFDIYTNERLADMRSYEKTASKEFRQKLQNAREANFPESNKAYYTAKLNKTMDLLTSYRHKPSLCLVDIEIFDQVCERLRVL